MVSIVRASLIAELVKNLPPTPVSRPGEFHGVHGVTKSQTRLNDFHFIDLVTLMMRP